MKGGFSAPGDYIYFKSQVPLHKIPIGTKQWRYYDFGPKVVPPLICIPGTAGTADVYYKQIMALSMKGYRVISIDIPRVWNSQDWVQSFEKFLDVIDVHHIHLYGTSLGGFLALLFAQHRPRRVKSLVLSNAFLETKYFAAAMPWAPVVNWTPSFLLKRYVLTGIPSGPHEPFIADSVDFVVAQVETLSREDLASRLTLTSDAALVGPLMLSDSLITIVDTNDKCAIPQQLKDEVSERFPGARRAYIKSGGDFPFLSRPDEVNLHLKLHLRRVGVEAREDLVPGIPKAGDDGGSGSGAGGFSEPKDDREDAPNEESNPESPSNNEGQPPLDTQNNDSHNPDNQPLLLEAIFEKKEVVLATCAWHFMLQFFVIYYQLPVSLLILYINNKRHPHIRLFV
ncbi:Maspardin [Artemisia annua]|uniref:Maspardin n=1 Tax=Artemisia annua TaxID=35608 RepID=A0A2U1LT05_ARTAN|nr:Maspardin [Artemisia annua]